MYHLGATHTPKCPCLLSIPVGSSPAQPHNPLPTLWPPRTRALAKWALSRSSCFPITSPKPTSSKYFPGIALPKKSVQVCQLRSAFQLLTQPPSRSLLLPSRPPSLTGRAQFVHSRKFSNNLSLKMWPKFPQQFVPQIIHYKSPKIFTIVCLYILRE